MCAHDDDEVIAVGGTIKKLTAAGVRVTTLVFAEGNEGYSRLDERDTIVQQRRKERQAAQNILGTQECIALGYHDYANLDCEDVYREIIRVVRTARPHIVFTHLPAEYLAHRTLAKVAPEAIWQAGWRCSLELGDPWKVCTFFQFSVLELIPRPSHIVDISNTFQYKLQAMEAYKSQHVVVAGILKQIKARAQLYGSFIGTTYGEAFVRSQYIPLCVKDPLHLFDDELLCVQHRGEERG
jgi:LmbE family N-acetylglucosaminyl deacetylase